MSTEHELYDPGEERVSRKFVGQFGPSFKRVVVDALEHPRDEREMRELFRTEHFMRYGVIFGLTDEATLPDYARLADSTKQVNLPENPFQILETCKRYGKAILRDANVDMVSFGSFEHQLNEKVPDSSSRDEIIEVYVAYLHWLVANNVTGKNQLQLEGLARERMAVNFPRMYGIIGSVPWEQWGGLLGASVKNTSKRYGIVQLNSYSDSDVLDGFVVDDRDDALSAYQKAVQSKPIMPMEEVVCVLQDMEYRYARGENTDDLVNSVMEGNLRLAYVFAKKYYLTTDREAMLERTLSGGLPGLKRAIELLDWRLNVTLSTYAGIRIRSSVQKVYRKERYPWMKDREIDLYHRFMRAATAKEQEVQHELSSTDYQAVWDEGGFDPSQREHFFNYLLPSIFSGGPVSLDQQVGNEDDRTLAEIISVPTHEAPISSTAEQARERAVDLLRLRGGMSDFQRFILEQRLFFTNGSRPPAHQQIAEDYAGMFEGNVVSRERVRQEEVLALQLFERNIAYRLELDLSSRSTADLNFKLRGVREGALPERTGPVAERIQATLNEAMELVLTKDFNAFDDLVSEESDVIDYGLRLGVGNIDQFVAALRKQRPRLQFQNKIRVDDSLTIPYRATLLLGILRHHGYSWQAIYPIVESYSKDILKEFGVVENQRSGPDRLPEVFRQIRQYMPYGDLYSELNSMWPGSNEGYSSRLSDEKARLTATLYDEIWLDKFGLDEAFFCPLYELLETQQYYIDSINRQGNGSVSDSNKIKVAYSIEGFTTSRKRIMDMISSRSYAMRAMFNPFLPTIEQFNAKAVILYKNGEQKNAIEQYLAYMLAIYTHKLTGSRNAANQIVSYNFPNGMYDTGQWLLTHGIQRDLPKLVSDVEYSVRTFANVAVEGEEGEGEASFFGSSELGSLMGVLFTYSHSGSLFTGTINERASGRYLVHGRAADALTFHADYFNRVRRGLLSSPIQNRIYIDDQQVIKYIEECKTDVYSFLGDLDENLEMADAFISYVLRAWPETSGRKQIVFGASSIARPVVEWMARYLTNPDGPNLEWGIPKTGVRYKGKDMFLKDSNEDYAIFLLPEGMTKFEEYLERKQINS